MASPHFATPQSAQAGNWQSFLTWSLTIAACAYIAWTAISLYRSTGAFRNMFASMGVELPVPTLFLVHNYHWCYPGVFWAMAALVIVKQFFIPEKWKSLGLSLLVALVANFAANGAIQALYRPIFYMLQKLSK